MNLDEIMSLVRSVSVAVWRVELAPAAQSPLPRLSSLAPHPSPAGIPSLLSVLQATWQRLWACSGLLPTKLVEFFVEVGEFHSSMTLKHTIFKKGSMHTLDYHESQVSHSPCISHCTALCMLHRTGLPTGAAMHTHALLIQLTPYLPCSCVCT